MLTEEILRKLNVDKYMCVTDLMQELSQWAQESKTTKLWAYLASLPDDGFCEGRT